MWLIAQCDFITRCIITLKWKQAFIGRTMFCLTADPVHSLVMSVICVCFCFRGHVMPMPSLTSHLIMQLIYVSCAVMSLTCLTVRMLSAGGGGAVEELACFHQSTYSQFTTELQLCVSPSCTAKLTGWEPKTYSSITHTLHRR